MIAPTSRAIVMTTLGAPLSLVIATAAPQLWPIGVAWAAAMFALVLIDAFLAPSGGALRVRSNAPRMAGIGAGGVPAVLTLDFGARRDPSQVEVALETNPLMRAAMTEQPRPVGNGAHTARFKLDFNRRGEGILQRAFVRWRGPMGLAWREQIEPMDEKIAITPNIHAIEEEAARLFSRTMMHGVKPLRDRGDGSEFDALAEFQPGMDRRLIDWKQTARHNKLLAKEVRAERNHQIVFAIDTGRLMCEPVFGAPRIDWALNGALMLSYVGLRLGDRVSFFGFDAKPHLTMGFVTGAGAFAHVQAMAAKFDYSNEETNFTLGLATLAERLQRRGTEASGLSEPVIEKQPAGDQRQRQPKLSRRLRPPPPRLHPSAMGRSRRSEETRRLDHGGGLHSRRRESRGDCAPLGSQQQPL